MKLAKNFSFKLVPVRTPRESTSHDLTGNSHQSFGPTSMEAHIGRPASHPGQFSDEIDKDAVVLSLHLIDLIESRIPRKKQEWKHRKLRSPGKAGKAEASMGSPGFTSSRQLHDLTSLLLGSFHTGSCSFCLEGAFLH